MARLNGISANLNAFLDMIASSEIGHNLLAKSDDGYNVIVGGKLFNGYKDHPRVKVDLPRLSVYSTAAGRYQILMRNFDAYKKQLKLPDFSPESQDRIAIQMIRECGALNDIESGLFEKSVIKCAHIWASFPSAGYGQHENAMYQLKNAFIMAGGKVANFSTEHHS